MSGLTLIFALCLALIHLGSEPFLPGDGRASQPLALPGRGTSVAYVFVHRLPKLKRPGRHYPGELPLEFLEHHVYIVALLGSSLFTA